MAGSMDRSALRDRLGLRGRVALFAGRLDAQKGLTGLLAAWKDVVARMPEATLVVAGAGPQQAHLTELAASLGLAQRVRFCGMQEDLVPWLQAADLFVLPSLSEGLSNALLEAMACALPCVATRIGGNTELIAEGINGRLVEPGDEAALAEAMASLLSDPEQAAELGRRARATVTERYPLPMIGRRYLALYDELLTGRSRV